MKKQVQTLLNQTPEIYERKTFELWFKWCQSVTGKQNEFQMVLCNPPINRWFHAELIKWEQEFLLRVRNYPNATLTDLHEQYHACIVQLFNISPSVLVREVFKQLRAPRTSPPTPKKGINKGETATLKKVTVFNHFQLN